MLELETIISFLIQEYPFLALLGHATADLKAACSPLQAPVL